ncbi:MAG: prepilin peptidase [Brevundimonas sp.]|uniref:prepilin peptidase n=1 Tax=Brevundimonas sp. TaxID=1871086 RepID=UPI001218E3BC|nr:A24 family peptidase [Brevundimonas sp.]RZJ18046.1 MAG: prepilin peptidase [Brevundimonas sp.]
MAVNLTMALLLAGAGLLIGSFLALVSVRLPLDEPIVLSRSRCRDCGRTLSAWRLIPLLGWLGQRGRCRDCGSPISVRYPAMEAVAAGIGVWAAVSAATPVEGVMLAMLGWQLLLIAVVDGEHQWLPDVLTAPLFVTGLAAALWLGRADWSGALIDAVAGAAVGFGGLWLLAWLYRRVRGREGLGGGDPFLLGAGGAWVGWLGLPSVLLWASAAGLSLIVARLALRRPVGLQDRLAFGVFLAAGIWLTRLYGPLGL